MSAPAWVGPATEIGAGLVGGELNRQAQERANKANAALQREFAQNGIRWRVADAQAAGIHPLFAMGASVSSGAPSFVGDTSLGSSVAEMGQTVNRAISATSTQPERQLQRLQLEHAGLQNEFLRARIRSEERLIGQGGAGIPGHTSDTFLSGQGDKAQIGGSDPRVLDVPLQRTVSDPNFPAKEAGALPDYQIVRTGKSYAVVPGADVKQRIEDDFIAEQQWKVRTYGAVMRGDIRFPDGRRAMINPLTGELVPIANVKKFLWGKDSLMENNKGGRW